MGKQEDFKRLKRRWYLETAIEMLALLGFFGTWIFHGSTNDLIGYGVVFWWSKSDADELYRKMMSYGEPDEHQ